MKLLLTIISLTTILKMHSQKTGVGIAVLKLQRRKPLLCGFFTRKISVHHYVGLGKTVERLASSLGWYCNLIQSNAIIAVLVLGFKILPTEAVMLQHSNTQEPTKTRTLTSSVNLISLFILKDSNRKTIAQNLTFNQVKPISKHIKKSVVKFQKMGVSA